jgi:teichuronic acid biosynthesis glycosyltransferase TuaG
MPKVSIILPTYNRANFIADAIESVIAQTFINWELFIVDDGSTDNTPNIVSKYLKNRKIKYFTKENGGVSSARNLGLKLSTGKYIAFLDSDDKWLPEKLECQLKYLDAHSDIDVVYTPMFVQDLNGKISSITANKMLEQELKNKYLLKSLLLDGFIPMLSTVLIRRSKIKVLFNEKVRSGNDFIFFIELGLLNLIFYGLKKPLAIYRKGQDSITSNRYLYLKNALIMIESIYNKACNFPININTAKSYRYLTFAKDILRSSTIKKQYGLAKKNIFYISTLVKSFYHDPMNMYIYKHLLKDIPREIFKRCML